ncbi:hypothetical protein BC940DRAFT_295129 [Gongronella butleri]|nr:hypothetical protein BC940DRAFT_295129 [Gongronella butleri]
MQNDNAICRVCRSIGRPDRPLYHPCKCAGSIRYVHEECLLEWLSHCNKSRCELCDHPFVFVPVYEASMPAALPKQLIVFQGLRHMCRYLARCAQSALFIATWLGVVPCALHILGMTGHVQVAIVSLSGHTTSSLISGAIAYSNGLLLLLGIFVTMAGFALFRRWVSFCLSSSSISNRFEPMETTPRRIGVPDASRDHNQGADQSARHGLCDLDGEPPADTVPIIPKLGHATLPTLSASSSSSSSSSLSSSPSASSSTRCDLTGNGDRSHTRIVPSDKNAAHHHHHNDHQHPIYHEMDDDDDACLEAMMQSILKPTKNSRMRPKRHAPHAVSDIAYLGDHMHLHDHPRDRSWAPKTRQPTPPAALPKELVYGHALLMDLTTPAPAMHTRRRQQQQRQQHQLQQQQQQQQPLYGLLHALGWYNPGLLVQNAVLFCIFVAIALALALHLPWSLGKVAFMLTPRRLCDDMTSLVAVVFAPWRYGHHWYERHALMDQFRRKWHARVMAPADKLTCIAIGYAVLALLGWAIALHMKRTRNNNARAPRRHPPSDTHPLDATHTTNDPSTDDHENLFANWRPWLQTNTIHALVFLLMMIDTLVLPGMYGACLAWATAPLRTLPATTHALVFSSSTRASTWCLTILTFWALGAASMAFLFRVVHACRCAVRPGLLNCLHNPVDPAHNAVRRAVATPLPMLAKHVATTALVHAGLILACVSPVAHALAHFAGMKLERTLTMPSMEMIAIYLALYLIVSLSRPRMDILAWCVCAWKKTAVYLCLSSFLFDDASFHDDARPQDAGHLAREPNANAHVGAYIISMPRANNDTLNDATKQNTAIVYVPSHFKLRMTLLLASMWATLCVLLLTIAWVPLAIGRAIFDSGLLLPNAAWMPRDDLQKWMVGIGCAFLLVRVPHLWAVHHSQLPCAMFTLITRVPRAAFALCLVSGGLPVLAGACMNTALRAWRSAQSSHVGHLAHETCALRADTSMLWLTGASAIIVACVMAAAWHGVCVVANAAPKLAKLWQAPYFWLLVAALLETTARNTSLLGN